MLRPNNSICPVLPYTCRRAFKDFRSCQPRNGLESIDEQNGTKLGKEAAVILQRKKSLLLRPIGILLQDPHLLMGWLAREIPGVGIIRKVYSEC